VIRRLKNVFRKAHAPPQKESLQRTNATLQEHHKKDLFEHLSVVGWKPNIIVDIGVATGTPSIYNYYPDAYYILVDAVREYEPQIRTILETLDGEYHITAVSEEPGEMEMMVQEPLYISSLNFDKKTLRKQARRIVPVTTIDDILEKSPRQGPILLKTDCQGHDLQVIRGAKRSLPTIDVIICELPVYQPWGGGHEFYDYVVGMHELGYSFYDIWGWLHRPGDQRLQHLDLVFVHSDGPLRQQPLFTEGEHNLGHYERYTQQPPKSEQ